MEFLQNISSIDSTHKLLPDIIFLDINMPILDGFKFAEEFMKFKNYKKPCKIIILTSSINPEDEQLAHEKSIIHSFVRKPLNKETLFHIKSDLINSNQTLND